MFSGRRPRVAPDGVDEDPLGVSGVELAAPIVGGKGSQGRKGESE